jgi:adenosylhomocysteine nucleosidase
MTPPPAVRSLSRCAVVALALLLSSGPLLGQSQAERLAPGPIAVIGITREVASIEARLADRTVQRVRGVTFVEGVIDGARIVVARAGIGKVGAALVAALLIDHFSPTAVLFSGTAGAVNPELAPGDVIVGTSIGHHDFGRLTADRFLRLPTRRLAGEVGPAFFPADPELLSAARRAASIAVLAPLPGLERGRAPRIREGVIVTGEAFIASSARREELRRELQADAVEMEGAAVAQVCVELSTPAIVIRSITDRADGEADGSYLRFVEAASQNAAAVALATIREWRAVTRQPR